MGFARNGKAHFYNKKIQEMNMPQLRYHSKLHEIIYKLDYSKIGSKNIPENSYYNSSEFFYGNCDTIFEGRGATDKLWISVNIIEGQDDLYLHTSLKIKNSTALSNVAANFSNFNQNTTLIKVDSLTKSVPVLIQTIETNIFPYL